MVMAPAWLASAVDTGRMEPSDMSNTTATRRITVAFTSAALSYGPLCLPPGLSVPNIRDTYGRVCGRGEYLRQLERVNSDTYDG